MKTRLIILFAICLSFGGTFLEARPNILFIYTDDQGPWTPGYTGNKQSHTPNLDQLSKDGATFENAFVTTPVCSPSRATLLTGRYASEFGILDWIPPSSPIGLDPATPVWPRLLQKAGYRTALIGKWHVGHLNGLHPTKFGYDEFMGIPTGGTKPKDPTLEVDGKKQIVKGLTMDILTDHAIGFMEKHKEQPFALSLHYRAPHAAFLPVSEDDWSHVADLDIEISDYPDLDTKLIKRQMREYLASVAGIDRNLGRLLKRIKSLGLEENTVVIFTSDHGYNMGHHGLWSKGNALWRLKTKPPQKWPNIPATRRPNMFDTSLKVPLVVYWPGVTEAGRTITETTSNLDWFPTLCKIAGVEIPDEIVLRGRSIVPLLKSNAEEWDNTLYGEYSMQNGAKTDMRMIRTPEWKWMRDFNNEGRMELYHLKKDPGETVNLMDPKNPEYQSVIEKLDEQLRSRMQETGDPLADKF